MSGSKNTSSRSFDPVPFRLYGKDMAKQHCVLNRPKSWSVFMQPIRTNSPIESYHSRLKRLAKKPHLNLYLLIELLHTESQMVPFKSFLLATDKLAENQKKSTSHFTSTLFAYWENFNTGKYGSVETLYEDLTDLIFDNYKYNFNHNI